MGGRFSTTRVKDRSKTRKGERETSASRYATRLLPSHYDDAAPAPGYLSVHCSPRISSPARVQVLESSIANPPSKPGSPSASTYFLNAFPARFFFPSCKHKCRLLYSILPHEAAKFQH